VKADNPSTELNDYHLRPFATWQMGAGLSDRHIRVCLRPRNPSLNSLSKKRNNRFHNQKIHAQMERAVLLQIKFLVSQQ
jgi:hypothetical protein